MFTLNDKIELTAPLKPHFIVRIKYVLFPIKIKQKCMYIIFKVFEIYFKFHEKSPIRWADPHHIGKSEDIHLTVQADIMNINRLCSAYLKKSAGS